MTNIVSNDFIIGNVEHSDYAMQHNINNTLPNIYIDNAVNLHKYILEALKEKFGKYIINSWYRSSALNKALGGVSDSQHCTASAADIEVPGVSNLEVALWIRDNLEFDQLILENYHGHPSDGWVHCSWKNFGNRNESLRFDGHVYIKGLE